jgi:hypothetical protein
MGPVVGRSLALALGLATIFALAVRLQPMCPSPSGRVVPPGRVAPRNKTLEPFVFVRAGTGYVPIRDFTCPDGDRVELLDSAPLADAVIFQDPNGKCELICATRAKTMHDYWVLESLEAPSCRAHAGLVRHFDWMSTYKRSCGAGNPSLSYQHSYAWHFAPSLLEEMRRPPIERNGTVAVPVFWGSGNCWARSGRHYFVEELMKHINVSCYGSCLNNAESKYDYAYERLGINVDPGDILFGIPGELAKRHLFYISMENSNCEDYVTEKFVKALRAGVVPIIDGPSSYDAFLPAAKSAIRADEFDSPAALAAYLNYLASNRTAYLSYMPWKVDRNFTFLPSFLELYGDTRSEAVKHGLRLCALKTLAESRDKMIQSLPGCRLPDTCERPGKWKPFWPWALAMFVMYFDAGTVDANVASGAVLVLALATLLAAACIRTRKENLKRL